MKPKQSDGPVSITVTEPQIKTTLFTLTGTAPLVIHRFGEKAKAEIREKQEGGMQSRGRKKREPKDFEAMYQSAFHKSTDGWYGFPTSGLRQAMIAACRTTDLTMTSAKLALNVEPQGFGALDGVPLFQVHGEPEKYESYVRIGMGGTDICVRPMWRKWTAEVAISFDADLISLQSIANLLLRAGCQVGIGEGRPFSKKSCGQGWGTFTVRPKGANNVA